MQHFSLKLYSLNNSDCGGEPLPVKSRQPGEKYEVKLNWRNILFILFFIFYFGGDVADIH